MGAMSTRRTSSRKRAKYVHAMIEELEPRVLLDAAPTAKAVSGSQVVLRWDTATTGTMMDFFLVDQQGHETFRGGADMSLGYSALQSLSPKTTYDIHFRPWSPTQPPGWSAYAGGFLGDFIDVNVTTLPDTSGIYFVKPTFPSDTNGQSYLHIEQGENSNVLIPNGGSLTQPNYTDHHLTFNGDMSAGVYVQAENAAQAIRKLVSGSLSINGHLEEFITCPPEVILGGDGDPFIHSHALDEDDPATAYHVVEDVDAGPGHAHFTGIRIEDSLRTANPQVDYQDDYISFIVHNPAYLSIDTNNTMGEANDSGGQPIPGHDQSVTSTKDDPTLTGKIVQTDVGDVNGNHVPDYADHFLAAAARPLWAPITVTLPANLNLAVAKFQLHYSSSDPLLTQGGDGVPYAPAPGDLRIWDNTEQNSHQLTDL